MRIFFVSLLVSLVLCVPQSFATNWFMVTAGDFRPSDSDIVSWVSGAGRVYSSGAGNKDEKYEAPVRLPIGSTVSGLYCQVRDSSTSYSTVVELIRVGTRDDGQTYLDAMASLATGLTATPGSVRIYDTSVNYSVVDDWKWDGGYTLYYTYVLRAKLNPACGSNCWISACSVGYTQ